MTEKKQSNRWRCLMKGCNPYLDGSEEAQDHREEHKNDSEPHRVAKWPVRSPEGIKRAQKRNKSGYYEQYNQGSKSVSSRGFMNLGDGKILEVNSE